jgi:uncharacterized membrane protein
MATAVLELIRNRWLGAVNTLVAVFVGLPFVAPMLMASGYVGAANAIYAAYRTVCHQWAFRSYFLFGPELTYGADALSHAAGEHAPYSFLGSPELGYKVAFCERDVAIYLAVLAAGLAYARYRSRIGGLGVATYALLILPMALDGVSQLLGWHESTVVLRTVTGALFGVASVWLIYPRVDAVLARDLDASEIAAAPVAAPPSSTPPSGARAHPA